MSKRKARQATMTTPELIALAKRRLAAQDVPERRGQPMTDYRFAKIAGFRQNVVSAWQSGRSRIGRQFVTRFAELTGLPEAYVYACVELERETDPGVRGILSAIADGFAAVVAKRAAAVTLAVLVGGALPAQQPAQAAPGPVGSRAGVCILWQIGDKARGRGWRRRRRLDRPGKLSPAPHAHA